jgi:molybdopterin molybdotransferase
MISFKEALEIVIAKTQKLPSEVRAIRQALGYSLAKPILASGEHPPFNLSAIDGYAVRSGDVASASETSPVSLQMVAKVLASSHPEVTIKPGQAALVMTGAVLPEGSDAVIPIEYVRAGGNKIQTTFAVEKGVNVRYRGSELKTGDGVLETGTHVTPGTVAMLAMLGYSSVTVHKKPRIAVVTTGDELIDVSQPVGDGKVRDANAYFLSGALSKHNLDVQLIERVPDDRERLLYAVSKSIESADIVIVTGGVSVAEYNVIGPIFKELGVEQHFWEVALNPVKPVFFGTKGPIIVFGLPGNPVFVGVLFYELILPAILTMAGRKAVLLQQVQANLETSLTKRAGRMEFIRGYLSWLEDAWSVVPFMKQESHMLSSFAKSNCIIVFPAEKDRLERGEQVEVHLLPWFYN